jgi:hypothetical protein
MGLCRCASDPQFNGGNAMTIESPTNHSKSRFIRHYLEMVVVIPGDGEYTFPGGLATVTIDHERNRGFYWEPNVWIVHTLNR